MLVIETISAQRLAPFFVEAWVGAMFELPFDPRVLSVLSRKDHLNDSLPLLRSHLYEGLLLLRFIVPITIVGTEVRAVGRYAGKLLGTPHWVAVEVDQQARAVAGCRVRGIG